LFAVALAFFAGLTDLAAEMLVLRAGRFGLGASAASTATLLALALAGYGLGAALATRQGGLRRFAGARAVAGVLGAVGAWLPLELAGTPWGAPVAAPAVSLVMALTFLVPSGMSLPVLFEWAGTSASRASMLLASNTLGSIAGVALGGLFGPIRLGTAPSAVLVLAVNLTLTFVAAFSVVRERRRKGRGRPAKPEVHSAPPPAPVDSARVRLEGPVVALAAGVCTIALESIFVRLTPFFLDERSDALATVLASALLGIALGNAIGGLALQRIAPRFVLGVLLAFLVFAGPVGLLVLDGISRERWIPAPAGTADWWWARVTVGLVLVMPGFIVVGALSPVAFALTRGTGRERAARMNVAYSLGALLPAAGLPFLLTQGATTSLVLGSIGAVALPAGLVVFGVRILALGIPIAAGAFLGFGALTYRVPPFRGRPWLDSRESREGPIGLATAVLDKRRQEWTLFTNAFRAAATGDDYRYTRALAHLPALLAQKTPERAAIIAVGTGSTAAAALRHRNLRSLDLVEISGDVFDLLRWFRPASDALFPARAAASSSLEGGAFAPEFPSLDPRLRCVLDDGRRYVAGKGEPADLIVLEPLLPDTPAAYPFYTTEFYELARRKLVKGGVLAQWIPIHATEPVAFRLLVATFSRSFPHRAAFLSGKSLILLGSDEPLQIPAGRLDDALQDGELALDLRRAGCGSAGDIVAQCCVGDAGMSAFDTRSPLLDDKPRIERLGYLAGEMVLTNELENLDALIRAREDARNDPLPGVERLAAGEIEARRSAGLAYLRARRAMILTDLRRPLDAEDGRALTSLNESTVHPFAALDAFRRAAVQDLTEGRTLVVRGDVAGAVRVLERAAPATRDPFAWLLLGVCYLRSEREAEATLAASVAFALDPSCDAGILEVWRETRETKMDAHLTRLRELAAPIVKRLTPRRPGVVTTAENLTSTDVTRRVEGLAALARDRDELALVVERVADTAAARPAREVNAAATVAEALADPTLAAARVKLRAAKSR
jgi:hypothetical protein